MHAFVCDYRNNFCSERSDFLCAFFYSACAGCGLHDSVPTGVFFYVPHGKGRVRTAEQKTRIAEKRNIPKDGSIRALMVTEKQYSKIVILLGAKSVVEEESSIEAVIKL